MLLRLTRDREGFCFTCKKVPYCRARIGIGAQLNALMTITAEYPDLTIDVTSCTAFEKETNDGPGASSKV